MKKTAGTRVVRPERMLAAGFLAAILLGSVLLALPAASSTGKSIGLFNSFFTSASAVCVTGLLVVDTGTAFSLFGQWVLLVLIQLGGIGFMLFATLIMAAMGRKISLRGRVLIRESMSASTMTGLASLAGWYGLMALCIELAGAALLALRFVPMLGWGRGAFYSLFHAVSGFCNAGFDLMGGYASLTVFRGDPLVLLTMATLIILGGLGFPVILEVLSLQGGRRLSLQAKLVLAVSGGLLLFGTVIYACAEWNNPATLDVHGAGTGGKLLEAFFLSASMRTAGFSSFDLSGLRDVSKLISLMLMFIGASPASTGGGVKTTTISVLLLIVLSVVRGQEQVHVFGKRLPDGLMRRALAIMVITLMLLLLTAAALALAEPDIPMMDVMFEAASAITTVGISTVGTPGLSLAGKLILLPVMFFGRLGPLTMALALANRMDRGKNKLKYPEEKIMIG